MSIAYRTCSTCLQHFTSKLWVQVGGSKAPKRLLDHYFLSIGRDALCLLGCHGITAHKNDRHTIMGCNQCIDTRLTNDLSVDTHLPDSSRIIGVREDSMLSSNGAVITDKADTSETGIQAFHHVKRLVPAGN